jgi:hypothetical protein
MELDHEYDGLIITTKITNNHSSNTLKIDRVLITAEGINRSDTYPESLLIDPKSSKTITRKLDQEKYEGLKKIFIDCSFYKSQSDIQNFNLSIIYFFGFFALLIWGARYLTKERRIKSNEETLENIKTPKAKITSEFDDKKVIVLKKFSTFYDEYKVLKFHKPKEISLNDYDFNKKLLFDKFKILLEIIDDDPNVASTRVTFQVVAENFITAERYIEVQLNLKEWQKRCIGHEEFNDLGKLLRFATGFNYEDLDKEDNQ